MRRPTGSELVQLAVLAILLGLVALAASLGLFPKGAPIPGRGISRYAAPPWVAVCVASTFVFFGLSLLARKLGLALLANGLGIAGVAGIFIGFAWIASVP
jgi:hypothetical protein